MVGFKKTGKRFGGVIIIVIFGCFFYGYFYFVDSSREDELNNNGIYTVGRGLNITKNRYSKLIKYEYYYNNTKYFNSYSCDLREDEYSNSNIQNKPFIVKFSKEKPEISQLYINIWVSESTAKKCPEMGWDSIEFKKLFGE